MGKLNYLINTGPDLAFSVQYLSQFMSKPSTAHMDSALHVLKYLKSNPNQGIIMWSTSSYQLQVFYCSDWASCPQTRHSVIGFFISFRNSPLSWKFKKQATIALYSAEAKYRSIRRVYAKLSWLTRLLTKLTVPLVTPISLKCYNQAVSYTHCQKSCLSWENQTH